MAQTGDDLFDLERFVTAQTDSYPRALAELRAGRKRSHWVWYILPQIQGLGYSPMSVRYAIASLAEAKAYVAHPVLGPRLRECVATMNAHSGLSAIDILGGIDAQKFHSCVTLFAHAAASGSVFHEALTRYFDGAEDAGTLAILAGQNDGHRR